MDAGWRVRYAGDVIALHPAPTGRPHRYSYYFGARNRVWLARRNLPLPLGALYVARLRAAHHPPPVFTPGAPGGYARVP